MTAFKSQKTRMEYLVDRYERGAALGDLRYFNHAENLKQSWQAGIDPLAIHVEEARRIAVDPWFRISMNDWHHVDSSTGSVYRLGGSAFYEERLDLLIGKEGAAGWSEHPSLEQTMTWLQDFAHDEVRAMRRDIAIEVCERYDCTGFLFDFMRVPGYFRFGEERDNAHLITRMLRETRAGSGTRWAGPAAATSASPCGCRRPSTVRGGWAWTWTNGLPRSWSTCW